MLPGVTVTLTSAEGTVGGNRDTTTDERGTYQFLRLVPGTYTVRAELQGFRRASQDKLVVNADVTVRADLKLEVGSTEESITVSGQSPLLDTTTALNQTVLSRTELDALPIIERSGKPHGSTNQGVMHACGHDGHTAMLLGAAKLLSEQPDFDGVLHFVF